MRKRLIALMLLTSLITEGWLTTAVIGQEVRHSPNIGLSVRERASAINALIEWLNASGMKDLSNNLSQALISGDLLRLHQDISRVNEFIEEKPALYSITAEVFEGLKAAEGLDISITPDDMAFLLLIAYRQAARNDQWVSAEAILKVLRGGRLSTHELESVLLMIKRETGSEPLKSSINSGVEKILKALHNESLLTSRTKTELTTDLAINHSLILAILFQAYKPERSHRNLNGISGSLSERASREATPEDLVKAMYILEKFGPKALTTLRRLPLYRVLTNAILPNSTTLSMLKSMPYGSIVSIGGVGKTHIANGSEGPGYIEKSNSIIITTVGGTMYSVRIPSKTLTVFEDLTNEIKRATSSSYQHESALEGKPLKDASEPYPTAVSTARNSSSIKYVLTAMISLSSLIVAFLIWMLRPSMGSSNLPLTETGRGLNKGIHPFWIIVNKYAKALGISLKPSLTHREAYALLVLKAGRFLSERIAGLIMDLMMIYELVTYRGDSESLYISRVNHILRELGKVD